MAKERKGKRGAKVGNNNAARARVWTNAILEALEIRKKKGKAGLLEMAENFLELCDDKDMAALRELGDRLEGKPIQAIVGTGEDGVIPVSVIVKYVNSAN